jgi:hypothetical protein
MCIFFNYRAFLVFMTWSGHVHRVHSSRFQSVPSQSHERHTPTNVFSHPPEQANVRHYFVLSHTTSTHPIIITMARPKKSGRPKRQQWQTEEQNETVDDLAHAAMFAIVPPVVAPTVPDVEDDKEDDNEIEMTEDEADNSDDEGSKSEKEENKNDQEEDDDDDDSDVDLAEAVAKMQEADEDEPTKGAGAPPKTQNEVDAYQTPIQDLENHLEFQLTVQDDDDALGKPLLRNLDASNLSLAGRVKHNMLLDRTVVVESMAPQN